jgi:hypothetical protein
MIKKFSTSNKQTELQPKNMERKRMSSRLPPKLNFVPLLFEW